MVATCYCGNYLATCRKWALPNSKLFYTEKGQTLLGTQCLVFCDQTWPVAIVSICMCIYIYIYYIYLTTMRLFPTPQLQGGFNCVLPPLSSLLSSSPPQATNSMGHLQWLWRTFFSPLQDDNTMKNSLNIWVFFHNPRYDPNPLCDHFIYHSLIISKQYISIHCIVRTIPFPIEFQ